MFPKSLHNQCKSARPFSRLGGLPLSYIYTYTCTSKDWKAREHTAAHCSLALPLSSLFLPSSFSPLFSFFSLSLSLSPFSPSLSSPLFSFFLPFLPLHSDKTNKKTIRKVCDFLHNGHQNLKAEPVYDIVFLLLVCPRGCYFLSFWVQCFDLRGSILEPTGRLWRPFGPSGRPRRFRTSFVRSFFGLWAPFWRPWGAQASPREPKGAQLAPKVSPKVSKSDPKSCIFRIR